MATIQPEQLTQLAARAAITLRSEETREARLTDDYHDLLMSVTWLLEDAGVPLPDPNAAETQQAAWA